MKYRKVTISPEKLSDITKEQICALHHVFFDLPNDVILSHMTPREFIDIYYEVPSNVLVGTIGFQWIVIGDNVIMYIGNAVIDPMHHHAGLLTKSIFLAILRTIIRFPTKKKYVISLASTPASYHYYSYLPDTWPRNNETTPNQVQHLIEAFLKKQNYTSYRKEGDIYLIPFVSYSNFKLINHDLHHHSPDMDWYMKKNKNYKIGEQMVVITPFNLKNFLNVMKRFMLDVPIKRLRHR